ncbi:hypothetical protein HDU76_011108, partial [Blyttiomyces sp. JEL0837]
YPFFMMFGRDARVPSDLFFGENPNLPPTPEEDEELQSDKVVEDLVSTFFVENLSIVESVRHIHDWKGDKNVPLRITPIYKQRGQLRVCYLHTLSWNRLALMLRKRLYSYDVMLGLPHLLNRLVWAFNIDVLYIKLTPCASGASGSCPGYAGNLKEKFQKSLTSPGLPKGSSIVVFHKLSDGLRTPVPPSGFRLDDSGTLWNKDSILVSPETPPVGISLWDSHTAPQLVDAPYLQGAFEVSETYLFATDDVVEVTSRNEPRTKHEFIQQMLTGLDAAYSIARVRAREEQEQLARESEASTKDAHKFEIGDLAWLSVPLRTTYTEHGVLTEKFMFRWCGPVRVIDVFGHDSQSNAKIVETYPGQERVVRHVHISRLRPYTKRIPLDSAERAADESQDDFETEVRNWENARILSRKPRGLQPTDTGMNRQLMRMLDPTFTEEDITNPELTIEKLKKFWFN